MAVFDIYTAKVYFDDDPSKFKFRPVVQVLEDASAPNAFAVITKNTKRKGAGEVEVKDHIRCNLEYPSTIRLTQRLSEPKHKKLIGRLDSETIIDIIQSRTKAYRKSTHKTEDIDDEFTINSILTEVIND